MFGDVVEIVNNIHTALLMASRGTLCRGLISLVTQFESKPKNGVLRQIRVWVNSPKPDIQEPR